MEELCDLYYKEATANDYDALLRTTLQWVSVE